MNADEIKLENLFGKTKQVKILDLVLPLNESTGFTAEQVAKALDSTERQIKPILEAMDRAGICERNQIGSTYYVNHKSKRIQSLKFLLTTIYLDAARINSQKRLGIK